MSFSVTAVAKPTHGNSLQVGQLADNYPREKPRFFSAFVNGSHYFILVVVEVNWGRSHLELRSPFMRKGSPSQPSPGGETVLLCCSSYECTHRMCLCQCVYAYLYKDAQKETAKSGKHASLTTVERGSWFNASTASQANT